MPDPYIGQIAMFAGNFAPRGWAFCEGQLLPITDSEALFSILGTTYGGDGRTTFALPDLRGRGPIHHSQGPGLTNRPLGSSGGHENVTLETEQIPSHSHAMACTETPGNVGTPVDAILGSEAAPADLYSDGAPDQTMNAAVIEPTGGGQSHDNMPPYLTISYIIAVDGVYPSRA